MKTILYLGLNSPSKISDTTIIHYPIIQTIPRNINQKCFTQFERWTHLIFTSQTAVTLFFEYFKEKGINKKQFLAVGKKTAALLQDFGIQNVLTAKNETAEGIIELIKPLNLGQESCIFWPHSALSRPVLTDFFKAEKLKFEECIFYDTVFQLKEPIPEFNLIDEIVFTSPSTVDAFFHFFPDAAKNKILTPIGKVTERKLAQKKV